jgi:hypothetical protein
MVSTVSARPNHYELLGLTPAASDDEIAQAFARRMSLFRAHPVGAAAQICIAYETLRDRIRRADYDRSLGLVRAPETRQWTMAVAQQRWTPFIASTATNAVAQAAREVARAPEPHVTAMPERQAPTEAKLSSFAASLRELARPGAIVDARGAKPRAEEPPPSADLERHIEQMVAVHRAQEEPSARYGEDRSAGWIRPVLAAGGFVVAAGLIGTLAGMSVRDGGDAQPADAALTPAIHVARPHTAAAVAAPASEPVIEGIDTPARRPVYRASRSARGRHNVSRHPSTSWAAVHVAQDQVADSAPVASQPIQASDPLAPQPSAAASDQPTGDNAPAAATAPTSQPKRTYGRHHYRRSHRH